MTHHIFFHADMDGMFSAAMVLNKFCGDEDYKLYPLRSNMRGESFNSLVKKSVQKESKIYILDFQNDENADLWIDHHPNYVFGNEPIFNKKIYYDYKSLSAFSLVYKYILEQTDKMKSADPEEHENIAAIAQFIDMVDSARYPSVDFVFENNSPGMLIYSFLETTFSSKMTINRVVEILSSTNMDLDRTIFTLDISKDKTEYMRKKASNIKKYIEIYEDSKISLVRQGKNFTYPRYAENYFFPHIFYNIRVSPDMEKGYAYLQMSYNIWKEKPNQINIGKFIKKNQYIKGGGHFNAGGGSIKYCDLDNFLDDISNIIYQLNNKEDSMEKYSVDKENDPVEKKAEHIKTAKDKKEISSEDSSEVSSDEREKAIEEAKEELFE